MKPVAGPVARTLSLIGECDVPHRSLPRCLQEGQHHACPKEVRATATTSGTFGRISPDRDPQKDPRKVSRPTPPTLPTLPHSPPCKSGFREHRSTMDQAAVLQHIYSPPVTDTEDPLSIAHPRSSHSSTSRQHMKLC